MERMRNIVVINNQYRNAFRLSRNKQNIRSKKEKWHLIDTFYRGRKKENNNSSHPSIIPYRLLSFNFIYLRCSVAMRGGEIVCFACE